MWMVCCILHVERPSTHSIEWGNGYPTVFGTDKQIFLMNKFYEILGRVTALSSMVFFLSAWSYLGQKTAPDDYYFERKQYEDLTQEFEFVIMRNRDEWNEQLNIWHGRNLEKDKLRAWTVLTRDVDEDTGEFLDALKCQVFIKDPEWSYEPEIIGHEISHCLWGEWHPRQKGG